MEKPAETKHSIIEPLANRWSPRAFSDKPVEQDKLNRIFEATRWAASSFNEQPWRFIIANKDQPEQYQRVLQCLVEKNQQWAQQAPVIGLTLAKKTFTHGGKPNRVYIHDVGLAMGNFCAQATAEGLYIHQMAGIDPQAVVDTFDVPEDFEAVAGLALGYGGEPDQLPEDWMRDAEKQPRTRQPFDKFVFTGKFGEPSDLVNE
jgi:nitroreductase